MLYCINGPRPYLNTFLIGYYFNAFCITGPLALILMLLLYGPTYYLLGRRPLS